MRYLVAACVSVIALLAGTVGAAAATFVPGQDPYASGSAGYDAASGQCNAAPPANTTFAILNVTSGRPFRASSCLGSLISEAGSRQLSLYFNTGYSGAYGRDIASDCSSATGGLSGKALQQAYQIGCSEASFAAAHAGGVVPAMWWLDVETGNSWSSSSTSYNAATIQGAIDKVHALGFDAGIYSTPGSWNTIVGSSTVATVDASWVWGGYGFNCPGTAFGAPIWVLQGSQTTVNGVTFDTDIAC